MKKKYFSILFLFIALMSVENAMGTTPVVSDASGTGQGTPFEAFVSEVSSLKQSPQGRIMASGTMSIKEGKYSGSSEFVLETGAGGYRVASGKNEIFSDGEFNYIVDNASKEVTVTFLDKTSRSVLSNPLSVLFELPQGFKVKSQNWQGAGNDRCYVVELLPEGRDTGLSFLKLHISPDGNSLAGLELDISQAGSIQTHVEVVVDAFSFSGQNSGGFTPDLDTLEQDGYFINDLR